MKSSKLYALSYRFTIIQLLLGSLTYVLYNIDNRQRMFTCDAGLACIFALPQLIGTWLLATGTVFYCFARLNKEFDTLKITRKPEPYYHLIANFSLIITGFAAFCLHEYAIQEMTRRYLPYNIRLTFLIAVVVLSVWSIITVKLLRRIVKPKTVTRSTKVIVGVLVLFCLYLVLADINAFVTH